MKGLVSQTSDGTGASFECTTYCAGFRCQWVRALRDSRLSMEAKIIWMKSPDAEILVLSGCVRHDNVPRPASCRTVTNGRVLCQRVLAGSLDCARGFNDTHNTALCPSLCIEMGVYCDGRDSSVTVPQARDRRCSAIRWVGTPLVDPRSYRPCSPEGSRELEHAQNANVNANANATFCGLTPSDVMNLISRRNCIAF